MNKVMISHSSKDRNIADVLAALIERISLKAIKVWFSSDNSISGGISKGSWYKKIIAELDNADILVVLLTPNSINNNWVLFETGYMSCKSENYIMPICVGINIDDIKAPISYLQVYDIMIIERLNIFLGRLLKSFNINIDSEAFQSIIKSHMDSIRNEANSSLTTNSNKSELSEYSKLKLFIEDKFNNLSGYTTTIFENYNVSFFTKKDSEYLTHFVEINENTSLSNVLDELYYKFNQEPFTYLEKWILVEKDSKKKLVAREIAKSILAKNIFNRHDSWEVVQLYTPYCGIDSHDNEIKLYSIESSMNNIYNTIETILQEIEHSSDISLHMIYRKNKQYLIDSVSSILTCEYNRDLSYNEVARITKAIIKSKYL